MYQSIVVFKLYSVVQSTPFNPTIFVQIHCNESRKPVGCAWIEVDSTNGRKREAWDDLTKRFSQHRLYG